MRNYRRRGALSSKDERHGGNAVLVARRSLVCHQSLQMARCAVEAYGDVIGNGGRWRWLRRIRLALTPLALLVAFAF